MPSLPRNRSLHVEQVADVTVVRFGATELLDEETIELLGSQLYALADHLGARKVILNLSPVKRMGSLMLGQIISLHRQLKQQDGKLLLCGLDPEIRRILDTLRVHQFLSLYKDEQEALQSF
jgi:anti-anti-sigma factor